MIEKYQFTVEGEKGRYKHPEIKDFKKLNKVVLAEGATNAAVSYRINGLNGLSKQGKAR